MFAEFIIQKKEETKMSDRTMARQIGLNTRDSLSKWRSRKSAPSLKNFEKVMQYFEVEPRYANAIWEDIINNRNMKEEGRNKHHVDTFGEHVIDDEFYKNEKELIDKYNGFKNVPESDKKLKRMRKLVGQ